jgi:dTDP-4-dehydrorhamnose 3,5-epimerase
MQVRRTAIPEVLVLEPRVHGDERGFFLEAWNRRTFEALVGRPVDFVQDNHSRSGRLVLRGLHFQNPHPQGKLVRVIQGEVFDVAVDVRRGSPTFGRWVGERLSAENKRQMWVPEGFAHGFLVLSDSADFLYKTTDYYHPEADRCIRWDDPDLAIEWPLGGATPIVAAKDAAGRRLADSPVFDLQGR